MKWNPVFAVLVFLSFCVSDYAQIAEQPSPATPPASPGVRRTATTRVQPTASPATPAPKKSTRSERLMLWPGESSTFEGVTVTWEVKEQDQATTGRVGSLRFKGPKTSLADIAPPIKRVANRPPRTELVGEYPIMVYLDDVLFTISGYVAGPAAALQCEARQEPSQRTYDAAPRNVTFPISSVCPVSLNQWKLTFSSQPKKYPDGEEYFELAGADGQSGTPTIMPLARVASRRFGRFDVSVGQVCLPTRTALLSVSAQPDLTVRGADAYVASPGEELDPLNNETNAAYFERLGKKYGVEVKWAECPELPDGAALLKQAQEAPVQFSHNMTDGTLKEMFGETNKKVNVSDLAFKWSDATHLEVSPNYEAKLAENKAEKERQFQLDSFRREYMLVTKVYALRYAQATTVKNLVQPLLNTHYLIADYDARRPGDDARPWVARYRVDTSNPDRRNAFTTVLTTVAELSAVDERTNSLIVTATPATHKKITETLQQMDSETRPRPGGRAATAPYRIEVFLLQGGKAGEKVEDVSRAMRLSFPVAGMIRDLPAPTGLKIKPSEMLARLDPTDQELRLRQTEIELMQAESELRVVSESSKRTAELVKTGLTSQDEALKAQVALTTAQGKVEAARLALVAARTQLDRCDLRAPTTGTVASVPVNLNERVEPGQVVLTLVPETKPGAKDDRAAPAYDPKMAAEFGISPDDLKVFGFDAVAQLGKGLVTLSPERGEMGRALVSLSEAYRCEVEFQDVRWPYVIVKGRLLGAQSDKPLMENALFLEKDKPSVVGLTNLRQALILVLRLYDAPGAPSSPAATTASGALGAQSERRRAGQPPAGTPPSPAPVPARR